MSLTSLQGQSQPAFVSPSGSRATLQSTVGCCGSVKKVGRPLVRSADCVREDLRRKCVPRLGPAEGPWQTGINARACIATHQWKSGSSALLSCMSGTEQPQSMMNGLERSGRGFFLVPQGEPSVPCQPLVRQRGTGVKAGVGWEEHGSPGGGAGGVVHHSDFWVMTETHNQKHLLPPK